MLAHKCINKRYTLFYHRSHHNATSVLFLLSLKKRRTQTHTHAHTNTQGPRQNQPHTSLGARDLRSREWACLAASLLVLDLLRTQRNSTLSSLCTGRRRLRLHPGLNLRSHGQKGLFDIGRCLGGGFQEFNPERVGKFLALLGSHDTLGGQIGLVADQELIDIFRSVSVNLVQPLLDVVEGFGVSNVVHDNDTVGAAVVRRGNRSEALLSGRVPNLQLDGLLVQINGANFLRES
jgi:hypothetical protein